MSTLRVFVDGARTAAENMAIDAGLLEKAKSDGAQPVLRFYGWTEPSYTVGYFQDPAHFARLGLPVAKRPTGGGAVLHGDDLTFSLAIHLPFAPLAGAVRDSYLKINLILLNAFKPLLPGLDFADCKSLPSGRASRADVCFEKPACYDLMLKGKKMVGSSQRRSGSAMLYQSSVFFPLARSEARSLIGRSFASAWGLRLQ